MGLKFIKIKTHHKILKNIFSLSILQFASYIFPLITIPYLTRVFGPEKYGLISYIQAFCAYFFVVVNYSFDLTATRDVAVNQGSIEGLSRVFSRVIFTKAILFIFATLFFLGIVLSQRVFNENAGIYFLFYCFIVGDILFPRWFYQGTENLSLIAVGSFCTKLIVTVFVFLLVRNSSDVWLYAIMISGTQILIGVILFLLAMKKYSLQVKFPGLNAVFGELKTNSSIFISQVAITLYTTSNVFILGTMADKVYVGYYTAALKVVTVVQMLVIVPIYQSLFPVFSRDFKADMAQSIRKLYKLLKIQFILTSALALGIFYFSPEIVHAIGGREFAPAILSLRILAFLPILMGLSNIFVFQGLLSLHKDRIFLVLVLATFAINLALNAALVPRIFDKGTAISALVSEGFLFLSGLYFFKRESSR